MLILNPDHHKVDLLILYQRQQGGYVPRHNYWWVQTQKSWGNMGSSSHPYQMQSTTVAHTARGLSTTTTIIKWISSSVSPSTLLHVLGHIFSVGKCIFTNLPNLSQCIPILTNLYQLFQKIPTLLNFSQLYPTFCNYFHSSQSFPISFLTHFRFFPTVIDSCQFFQIFSSSSKKIPILHDSFQSFPIIVNFVLNPLFTQENNRPRLNIFF